MPKGGRDPRKDQVGDNSPPVDDEGSKSWKDAWPFWVALIVVVAAILGVVLSNVLRPAEDRASDSAQVQFAINDVYTARNNVDYGKYKAATCATDVTSGAILPEAEFVAQNRKSVETNGRIVIPEITDVTVTGDRATARVHWHFDKSPDQTQVTSVVVVKDNGDWKVCKA